MPDASRGKSGRLGTITIVLLAMAGFLVVVGLIGRAVDALL